MNQSLVTLIPGACALRHSFSITPESTCSLSASRWVDVDGLHVYSLVVAGPLFYLYAWFVLRFDGSFLKTALVRCGYDFGVSFFVNEFLDMHGVLQSDRPVLETAFLHFGQGFGFRFFLNEFLDKHGTLTTVSATLAVASVGSSGSTCWPLLSGGRRALGLRHCPGRFRQAGGLWHSTGSSLRLRSGASGRLRLRQLRERVPRQVRRLGLGELLVLQIHGPS